MSWTAKTDVNALWTGRGDLQGQLDAAVDELRQKVHALQQVERNAVRAAMLEERARYCLFISAIKPLIVRFVCVLSLFFLLQCGVSLYD